MAIHQEATIGAAPEAIYAVPAAEQRIESGYPSFYRDPLIRYLTAA